MSYQFYLVLHFFGIFMILTALGGVGLHIINGGTREFKARKWAAIFHGVGLTIALVGGFGLLARLGIHSWPLWVIVKLVVWLILGALPALMYRQRSLGHIWWTLLLVLGLVAAGMAVYKPGLGAPDTPTVNPANDPALAPPEQSGSLEAAPSTGETP